MLLHYHLTRGNRLVATLCWPAILIVVIGTIIWHRSMTDIAMVMVVASSFACAGMLVIAWGRAELPRYNLIERANLALLDADARPDRGRPRTTTRATSWCPRSSGCCQYWTPPGPVMRSSPSRTALPMAATASSTRWPTGPG